MWRLVAEEFILISISQVPSSSSPQHIPNPGKKCFPKFLGLYSILASTWMDTFSSPVKSLTGLQAGGHHHSATTRRELYYHYQFKNSNTASTTKSHLPSSIHHSTPTSNKLLTPNFTRSRIFSTSNNPVSFLASSSSSFKQFPPSVHHHHHHKAASGYAAALMDVASRCHHSLEAVGKDVRRFSKWLRNEQLRAFMSDPLLEDSEKGQVVKEMAEKGRFHSHLVVLLKLLVEKNKVGIVSDVMHEFERIYDELTAGNHSPVLQVSSSASAMNL